MDPLSIVLRLLRRSVVISLCSLILLTPYHGTDDIIPSMKSSLTIGKLAEACQVNVETVRFYERKGILKQPKKQGAFRYYPEEYITRIRFIKRSQEFGFTISESKELLDLKIKNHSKCCDVLSRTEVKIAEVTKKIEELKKIKKSLEALANCCEDSSIPLTDCPVLECFMDKKEK